MLLPSKPFESSCSVPHTKHIWSNHIRYFSPVWAIFICMALVKIAKTEQTTMLRWWFFIKAMYFSYCNIKTVLKNHQFIWKLLKKKRLKNYSHPPLPSVSQLISHAKTLKQNSEQVKLKPTNKITPVPNIPEKVEE